MDPIEEYIVNVIGIALPQYQEIFVLTNDFGRGPGGRILDAYLTKDVLSRLRWSRYNVLFNFAHARYLCMDIFPPLIRVTHKPDGQLYFRRLVILFDFFKALGTLLDALAEEANIVYKFGIAKTHITIGGLRREMENANKVGTFSSPRQKDFIDAILPKLNDLEFERILQFRHLAVHRSKLRWITGDSRLMYLPFHPENDADDDTLWGATTFKPRGEEADNDLRGMLSRISDLYHTWYPLTTLHLEQLYVR